MWRIAWSALEKIGVIWTAISVVLLALGFLGLLPYYDIQYRRKSDITPRTYVYPGERVRLSAEFASVVELPDIERVTWDMEDSNGKPYGKLPTGKDIDVSLLPDYSGTITVRVKAKLRGESQERSGAGSIHIVQVLPAKLTFRQVSFFLPRSADNIDKASLEVYQGNGQWEPAAVIADKAGEIRLSSERVPVWGDRGFIRYQKPGASYRTYEYAALPVSDNAAKK